MLRTLFPRGAAFFGTFHLGRQLRETERFFLEADAADGEAFPVSRSAVAWVVVLALLVLLV